MRLKIKNILFLPTSWKKPRRSCINGKTACVHDWRVNSYYDSITQNHRQIQSPNDIFWRKETPILTFMWSQDSKYTNLKRTTLRTPTCSFQNVTTETPITVWHCVRTDMATNGILERAQTQTKWFSTKAPRPLNRERTVSSTKSAGKLNEPMQKNEVGPLAYKLNT